MANHGSESENPAIPSPTANKLNDDTLFVSIVSPNRKKLVPVGRKNLQDKKVDK